MDRPSNNKSIGLGDAVCQTCKGTKTLLVSVKGVATPKPCPTCKGSGSGSYQTK